MHFTRRKFLEQATVLGSLSLIPDKLLAKAKDSGFRSQERAGRTLIKGAYVLSMDPNIGELPAGDVLIENDKILEVAPKINDNKATVISGKDMIALPGFVETHWHVWTTMMRAMSSEEKGKEYFTLTSQYGKLFSPENTYHSSRLALAEAIFGGITHVHDWCHNTASLDHAQSSLRAIAESGIRARFSAGVAAGGTDINLDVLKKLNNDWSKYSNNDRVRLGLAWPGFEKERPGAKAEVETARALGLPISVHIGRKKDGSDGLSRIVDVGLLGKDMQFIHGIDTTKEEYDRIAKAGGGVSISPYSELRIGYGLPPIPTMLNSGAPLGFSVDTMPLTGNADMFAVMKIFQNLAAGMAKNEFQVSARRILEIATIEGAKSMGIADHTGSLTPGKKADLQLINTKAINLGVMTDPFHLLVTAGQPYNVDTVLIDGKIVKKGGRLTQLDTAAIINQAAASLEELKSRIKE